MYLYVWPCYVKADLDVFYLILSCLVQTSMGIISTPPCILKNVTSHRRQTSALSLCLSVSVFLGRQIDVLVFLCISNVLRWVWKKGSIAPMIEQNFLCFTGSADLEVLWLWLMKCAVDNATNAFGYHSKFHPPSSWNPRFPVYLYSLIRFGEIFGYMLCNELQNILQYIKWKRNLNPPSLVLYSQLGIEDGNWKVSSSLLCNCWFSLPKFATFKDPQ